MTQHEKNEFVCRFFWVDNYGDLADDLCAPGMEISILRYLAEHYIKGMDFQTLDISRLAACSRINESEALKELIFVAMDAWAEDAFRLGGIGSVMASYISTIEYCLQKRDGSDEKYTRQTGLAHTEVLRHYLNRIFRPEDGPNEMWEVQFPLLFADMYGIPGFDTVFLLMMLDEESIKDNNATALEEKAISMLVRCGYEYVQNAGDELGEPAAYRILCAVFKTSAEHKFYLLEEHWDAFSKAMLHYTTLRYHRELIVLIANGGDALQDAVCMVFEAFFGEEKYEDDYFIDAVSELVQTIPVELMRSVASRWAAVVGKAAATNA